MPPRSEPGPRARHRPCHRRRFRGFTLIEVLIAVILIDVGLLALVAASARLARHEARRRARAAAVRAVTNRLQWLAAQPCGPVQGSADSAHVRETWTAGSPILGVRELSDSVTAVVAGAPITVVLRTRLPC